MRFDIKNAIILEIANEWTSDVSREGQRVSQPPAPAIDNTENQAVAHNTLAGVKKPKTATPACHGRNIRGKEKWGFLYQLNTHDARKGKLSLAKTLKNPYSYNSTSLRRRQTTSDAEGARSGCERVSRTATPLHNTLAI